jgi:hypothetical protein
MKTNSSFKMPKTVKKVLATIHDPQFKSFYKQSMIDAEVQSKTVRKDTKKKNVTIDEE